MWLWSREVSPSFLSCFLPVFLPVFLHVFLPSTALGVESIACSHETVAGSTAETTAPAFVGLLLSADFFESIFRAKDVV